MNFCEYIWIDGSRPVQKLRSKTRVVDLTNVSLHSVLDYLPIWNFDGSSTGQAAGNDSERVLQPVRVYNDPLRENGYLTLCEVLMPDEKTPHESNTRAKLRKTLDLGGSDLEFWCGFEQEYTLLKEGNLLGWPSRGYPAPQGPYYCGVGADEVVGREVIEEHAGACLKAEIMLYGLNFEVMLGQAEFQIGFRGLSRESADALRVSDDLWLARYLLYRIGEKHNIYATLDPKPKKGDWNGSGMHFNFSDWMMRHADLGKDRINAIIQKLKETHLEHQEVYGYGNHERLTGSHETSPYHEFSFGVANRGTSIRIPNKTKQNGCGYLEDRRPAANSDAYVICNRMLQTLLSIK